MVDGLFAPASVYAAWAAGWRLLGRSPPPFYGRALFAVSTVVACVSHSATIDVMGLFLGSFREEGVSLGVLSSLLAVGTLANGALQPVSGRLIDKLGARVVTCWALAVLASGLLVLSISRGAAALALGFVLVRCGGISGCMLAQDTVLSKWFVRRLGRAVALQRCTQALLAVYCMPLFVGIALPRVGWRATLRFLALPPIATLPLAAATLLPTPESCGMRPDGEAAETTAVCQEAEDVDSEEEEMASLLAAACGAPRAAAAAPQPEPAQFTVRQALDTRALRLLLLLTAATTCTTGGITTHVSLICRDAGVSLSELATAVILPDAIAGFVANWVFGGAVDRGIVGLHALLAASLASLSLAAALGVLMLAAAGQPAGQRTVIAALFGAVYGFGSTSFYLFLKVAPPRLFGRTNAGAIMGVINGALFVGIALGGVAYGAGRQRWGSYVPALATSFAGMAAATALAYAQLRPPPPPPLETPGCETGE